MTTTLDPGTSTLPARALEVARLADAHAAEADAKGCLSTPVVEAFHREGLLGMWVPRSIRGGAELDAIASLEVLERVSYGDPSAGWVLMAASLAIGTGAAFLGDAAVEELFGSERLPVIAGQGTRPGTAVPVAGGYRLSGAWSFASGIKHATHIHTLGLVEGTHEPRIFVLPVGAATLIDNWDVMGLRATGSIDYTIDDVFVPEAYTHPAAAKTPRRGGPIFNIAVMGFAVMCHSGWACGIGRRLLDELSAKARGGVGRTGSLAASETFHEQYARAEGTYRAARAFVYETWRDVQATMDRGALLDTRQHTMIRLALAHATWACHEIAEFTYTVAGTVALRAGTIQRLFRDMHAGTQHITSAPPVIRNAGRELAGLASGKTWMFLDLVDEV
jgi:alkylation response protein AidB-like acyl-CoA dehydrogenase